MMNKRLALSSFALLLVVAHFGRGLMPVQVVPVLGDPTPLFFHDRAQIYRSENGSITVYDGADEEPPLDTEATVTGLRCEIMQQVPYSFFSVTAFVGVVSWVTQPLSQDYIVDGTVTVYIWLSSSDVNVAASGYAFGVTDLDEKNNVVGEPFYNYIYNAGKVISDEPTEYSLSMRINHVFGAGRRLGFQVLIGSTTQGWSAYVHFDSPDRNSRAELSSTVLLVPEFQEDVPALVLAVAIIGTIVSAKCKKGTSASANSKGFLIRH